jgi:hypothetical protein
MGAIMEKVMHKRSQIVATVVLLIAYVGGCSSTPKDPFEEWNAGSKYRNYVPASAKPVAQGTGTLTFTAPSDGTAYLLEGSQQAQSDHRRLGSRGHRGDFRSGGQTHPRQGPPRRRPD